MPRMVNIPSYTSTSIDRHCFIQIFVTQAVHRTSKTKMYTYHSSAIGTLLAVLLSRVTLSHQQRIAPNTNFTAWEEPTAYRLEQSANVSRYLEEARALSTPNFRHIFQTRCITAQVYSYLNSGATEPGWVEPYPAFDNVYFVGSTWVSAWAIDTGDGLILIDALDNADEAREIIIPGIQKFGFEGADIKAVIVTHEHADHYGGARWLQDSFDSPVYMSEVAWDDLATDPANPGGLIEPPRRNLTLEDGVGVTVGNVTVVPVATPGHTAGTVSLLFPVYENGVKHSKSIPFNLLQYFALANKQNPQSPAYMAAVEFHPTSRPRSSRSSHSTSLRRKPLSTTSMCSCLTTPIRTMPYRILKS